jgi:hypothetical protein
MAAIVLGRKISMLSKANKLLFVVAGVMLVGAAEAGPLWAQDQGSVSPNSLDGWQTLKFGMTPRQACAAMNQAGLKCTHLLGIISTIEARVQIGTMRWGVGLSFDDNAGKSLSSIQLQLCARDNRGEHCKAMPIDPPCDPESFIAPLEQQYGPFWRDPDHPGFASKRFANGAKIDVSAWNAGGFGCTFGVQVNYDFKSDYRRQPSPPPPAASGHF